MYSLSFVIWHSHYLGFRDSIKQRAFWKMIMRGPHAFDPKELAFRKDIKRDAD